MGKKVKVDDAEIIEEKTEEIEEKLVEGIGSDEEVEQGIQTTFNTDGLDILVVEGEIENAEVYNED